MYMPVSDIPIGDVSQNGHPSTYLAAPHPGLTVRVPGALPYKLRWLYGHPAAESENALRWSQEGVCGNQDLPSKSRKQEMMVEACFVAKIGDAWIVDSRDKFPDAERAPEVSALQRL